MAVYLIGVVDGCHKIGRSRNPEKRAEQWCKLPTAPRIVHTIKTDQDELLESILHRAFAAEWINGEWFRLSSFIVRKLRQFCQFDDWLDIPIWLRDKHRDAPWPNAGKGPMLDRLRSKRLRYQTPESRRRIPVAALLAYEARNLKQ